MKSSSFLNVIKKVDPEYQGDKEEVETTGWIDTGSYALNALLSASCYKGIPNNRVTCFAGSESTGKTYLALGLTDQFQRDTHGDVLYIDTEYATDKAMVTKRKIDMERFHIKRLSTVEEVNVFASKIVSEYQKDEESKPLMIVLDSLGNLSTTKEVEDTLKGENKRDMTRAQAIKKFFRTLDNPLGKAKIPMIITNHTYDTMSLYSPKELSGGSGLKYSGSTIVMLSKEKDKETVDGKVEMVGNIITAKTYKSRFSTFPKTVELQLNFKTGLNRYYGLLPLAEKYEVVKKLPKQYEFPDGSKHFESHIYKNAEKFFTSDIMEKIEIAAKKEYEVGE